MANNLTTTTVKMKSVKQQALERMDAAGRAVDHAYIKWLRNKTESNLRVLQAANQAYKQTQRTYQAACLVMKYNHGRVETVRFGEEHHAAD
jgi:hypothetical protein